MLITFGLIADISAETGFVKVYIPDRKITTEWIPFIRPLAMGHTQSIPLKINTLVALGKTCEERWVVFGSAPNDEDKPYDGASNDKHGTRYDDGTLIEYDAAAHRYVIDAVGEVVIKGATKVTVQSAAEVDVRAVSVKITSPVIELDGAVTITGPLVVAVGISSGGADPVAITGGMQISGGDLSADGISLKDHVHGGVTTGSGLTGKAIDI